MTRLADSERPSEFRLVHVFKISRGIAPSYLSDGFTTVKQFHSYNTRGSVSDNHFSDRVSTFLKHNSFGFKGRKGWNSLPLNIIALEGMEWLALLLSKRN